MKLPNEHVLKWNIFDRRISVKTITNMSGVRAGLGGKKGLNQYLSIMSLL